MLRAAGSKAGLALMRPTRLRRPGRGGSAAGEGKLHCTGRRTPKSGRLRIPSEEGSTSPPPEQAEVPPWEKEVAPRVGRGTTLGEGSSRPQCRHRVRQAISPPSGTQCRPGRGKGSCLMGRRKRHPSRTARLCPNKTRPRALPKSAVGRQHPSPTGLQLTGGDLRPQPAAHGLRLTAHSPLPTADCSPLTAHRQLPGSNRSGARRPRLGTAAHG